MTQRNHLATIWALRIAIACSLFGVALPAQAQIGGLGKIVKKAQDISNSKQANEAKNTYNQVKPLSLQQETDLGREVAAKMVGFFHIYNDPGVTQYVNLVGASAAAQSTRKDIQYHFAVLDSNDINAFSAPGGYVFVTRGALALCDDESELAGVLAHEVAHVADKHVLRVVEHAQWGQAGSQLASDYTSGSQYMQWLQNAAKNVLVKIIDQGLAPNDEFDADRDGVAIAHAAGYPADGLDRFLIKLGQATNQGANSFWTRTHPPVGDRNARIQQQIASNSWQDSDRPRLADRFAMSVAAIKPKS